MLQAFVRRCAGRPAVGIGSVCKAVTRSARRGSNEPRRAGASTPQRAARLAFPIVLHKPLETAGVMGQFAQHAAQRARSILHQVVQAVFQEMGLPGIGPPGQAASLGKQAEALSWDVALGWVSGLAA